MNTKKGVPCGNSFISPEKICTKGIKTMLDRIKEKLPERYPSSVDQKRRVVTALEMASSKKEQRAIMQKATNRLSPKQAQEILDRKMPNGMTLEEYAQNRGKGLYDLPGQKQRVDVSDDEVDLVWNSMTPLERNLIAPAGAGAPAREKKNNGGKSLVETDWGPNAEDRVRMRKAMLKALLQQVDDNGNIIDPWTGKTLSLPADLDHIRPIAAGGGHGIAEKGNPKSKKEIGTDYNSENWVWTTAAINRKYKNDRDVLGTVTRIKEATNVKAYEESLDNKIKAYLTDEKARIQLEDDMAKAASEAFSGKGHGLNSFPDAKLISNMKTDDLKAIMKGLESADPSLKGISKTIFDNKSLSDSQRKKAVITALDIAKNEGKQAAHKIRDDISKLTGTPYRSIALSPSIKLKNGQVINTDNLQKMLTNADMTINDLDDDSYVSLMFQLQEQKVLKFESDGTVSRGENGGAKGQRGGFTQESINMLNSSKRQLYTSYIQQDQTNPNRPKRSKNKMRPLEKYIINELGITNLPSYDNITINQAHHITNDIRSITNHNKLN